MFGTLDITDVKIILVYFYVMYIQPEAQHGGNYPLLISEHPLK